MHVYCLIADLNLYTHICVYKCICGDMKVEMGPWNRKKKLQTWKKGREDKKEKVIEDMWYESKKRKQRGVWGWERAVKERENQLILEKKDIYGTDKIKKTYFCVVLNKMAPIRLIDLNACLPMSCTIWND